jgi:hypothetical protein
MYRTLVALMSACLLAGGAGKTFAYSQLQCGSLNLRWPSNIYSTSAGSVSFPVGPWRDALASVVSTWNGNASLLAYSVSYDDPSVGLGNGQNEVWWSSGFGAPAITNWWFFTDTCTFAEADIRFDNTETYHYTTSKSSLWPYGGAFRPFQTTAMHEFGHAGGLGHTANTYNIMGQDWTHIHANGSVATAYPGEDAVSGMVATYGLWLGGPDDLGVAQWRWTGNSGEYSTHDRTRLFDAKTGVELPRVPGTTELTYYVKKGQKVIMELSYENMGRTSPLSAGVYYYVSTDGFISTGDTFLASGGVTISRDQVLTTSSPVLKIPSKLKKKTDYWLGAIIDPTGAVSEGNEANNATYLNVRVK